MKLLGYKQIEVRPMAVKDAEHQLNLEISENETRKDFSKSERINYARRLERIKFLESIKSRGVIEPIVITPDKVIVSGHQRVRACKELGIDSVMCDVHTYNNEDEILQDLLETNIRQRGSIGGSDKKISLRIKELERIYGIHQGNGSNQHEQKPKNSVIAKFQSDLAAQMGISVDTLQNYKRLADMIPELEELVDTGIVTKTTALAMIKNLSEDEQLNLEVSENEERKNFQDQKWFKSSNIRTQDGDILHKYGNIKGIA